MQYCHEQLKQLTTMLTEKKEELLKSEDRVVSLQADLSEARENLLDMHRNEHTSVSRGMLDGGYSCCCCCCCGGGVFVVVICCCILLLLLQLCLHSFVFVK